MYIGIVGDICECGMLFYIFYYIEVVVFLRMLSKVLTMPSERVCGRNLGLVDFVRTPSLPSTRCFCPRHHIN